MEERDGQRAYIAGLKMLGRRELSEKQIRERLKRREYPAEAIDEGVARLKQARALDDSRFAFALARHEISTKRHGRLRAQRQIEAAGIPPALAREALDEALAAVDPDALLEAALDRRLRNGQAIDDDAHFRRLYRFLLTQGFESDRVVRILKARRR
jgi:regulatory protein